MYKHIYIAGVHIEKRRREIYNIYRHDDHGKGLCVCMCDRCWSGQFLTNVLRKNGSSENIIFYTSKKALTRRRGANER